MSKINSLCASAAPYLLSLLRIVTAFIFMQHGTMKLFGFPASMGDVQLFSMIGFAGILEVFGGFLILIGLFTQPVAFLLSGEMAFAYFIAHFPQGFWPVQNHGEAAALYCFIYLYLASVGGGAWSVDRLIFQRNKPAPTH